MSDMATTHGNLQGLGVSLFLRKEQNTAKGGREKQKLLSIYRCETRVTLDKLSNWCATDFGTVQV